MPRSCPGSVIVAVDRSGRRRLGGPAIRQVGPDGKRTELFGPTWRNRRESVPGRPGMACVAAEPRALLSSPRRAVVKSCLQRSGRQRADTRRPYSRALAVANEPAVSHGVRK
jgi:hypothetical protein